jgi:septum formation protein
VSYPSLVLASSSPYRAELLRRLRLEFRIAVAGIDETPLPTETPASTAMRLAEAKARAIAASNPDALIIGSDQVLELCGEALGKPGDRAKAEAQLARLSGQSVTFHTALCLLDSRTNAARNRLVPTSVTFRVLSTASIRQYLDLEPAFDCAGSAKAEGLWISLMSAMRTEDPTALIGLPLIALTDLLNEAGFPVLQ